MSMHKKPLTEVERSGLEAHGLPIGAPSQCSDSFRNGVAWVQQRIAELERERDALAAHAERLEDAGDAMCGDAVDVTPRVVQWHEAVAAKPATSLDCLILVKQAEALEDVVSVFSEPDSESALDVTEYAGSLAYVKRQKARGDQ